jgi:hypothetical protein
MKTLSIKAIKGALGAHTAAGMRARAEDADTVPLSWCLEVPLYPEDIGALIWACDPKFAVAVLRRAMTLTRRFVKAKIRAGWAMEERVKALARAAEAVVRAEFAVAFAAGSTAPAPARATGRALAAMVEAGLTSEQLRDVIRELADV